MPTHPHKQSALEIMRKPAEIKTWHTSHYAHLHYFTLLFEGERINEGIVAVDVLVAVYHCCYAPHVLL